MEKKSILIDLFDDQKGAMVCLHMDHVCKLDAPTHFFFDCDKQNFQPRQIEALEIETGYVTSTQNEIE